MGWRDEVLFSQQIPVTKVELPPAEQHIVDLATQAMAGGVAVCLAISKLGIEISEYRRKRKGI